MAGRVSEREPEAGTEVAILEAARDLLAEGGLDALSMRGVAARVEISATAIYHYFENKQALVERVVLQGFERFEGYLRRAAEAAPRGSAERIHAMGEAYIRFALENRAYFQVLFALRTDEPRGIDDLPNGGGYYLLRQAVVEAMESGSIRSADPDLVVLYLWAHVHGLVTLFLACELGGVEPKGGEGEPLEAPRLFELLSDFVLNGLRPQAGPETAAGGGS